MGRRRKKRTGDLPPVKRRAGATGTRLTFTAAPSREIRRRQRRARSAGPVVTTWVDPDPHVANPEEPATEKQQRFVAVLAERLEVEEPTPQTRQDAAEAIGRLRQLAVRRGLKDPGAKRKNRKRRAPARRSR